MLVFQNKEMVAMMVYQTNPPGIELHLYANTFFCFSNPIDLFHNGGQIKDSSVLMLISLSSLATTSKFQENFCFKMRAVGQININTKDCKCGRHL